MKRYAKEFRLSTEPQRSAKWFAERAGKPSASGLAFLFDTLKDGYTPSSKAKKYLRQLAFERKFNTVFENFQTKAMKDGILFEDFAKMVYMRDTGNSLEPIGSYISDWFVATPDARVISSDGIGLLECKVVGDATFMELSEGGIPIEHERQTQAQMMASGDDWVDYIVVNLKTRAYFIQRIYRNNKLIKRIYERLHEPLDLPKLSDVGVKQFEEGMLQEYMTGNKLDEEDLIIPDLGF